MMRRSGCGTGVTLSSFVTCSNAETGMSSMDKKHVVQVLEEIATLLELSGENPFKSRSYVSVARELEQTSEDLGALVRNKRLREIKGVGDALEQKIEELVTTGRLEYHEQLRAKFPPEIFELFSIPSLGAKRIKTLYDELQITSLDSLEQACRTGELAKLKGFGAKLQDKVMEGIAFAHEHSGKFLLGAASREAERLLAYLATDPTVVRIEIAGSLRRRKEVIKDIDIVASSSDPAQLMKRFVEADRVRSVTGHGETKSSVVLTSGIAADLRVVTDDQFPYALHHFTGSKEHNVAMRQRAKDRDLKMNEYGLFRDDGQNVVCRDEAAIFAQLGLPFIPPELRENMGGIEAASFPALLEQTYLRGVIHCHTTYSDGAGSLQEMARAAQDRGYEYLLVTDHSQTPVYAGGLAPESVIKQQAEIDWLNAANPGFRILKGIESDIRINGDLDYDEDILRTFELIIASVHSKLDMTETEATGRVLRAVANPYTAILGHPTGRLLLSRPGYSLDYTRVFEACVEHHVAIEINSNCQRLDLDWRHIKRAKEIGVMFCISPDAHTVGRVGRCSVRRRHRPQRMAGA